MIVNFIKKYYKRMLLLLVIFVVLIGTLNYFFIDVFSYATLKGCYGKGYEDILLIEDYQMSNLVAQAKLHNFSYMETGDPVRLDILIEDTDSRVGSLTIFKPADRYYPKNPGRWYMNVNLSASACAMPDRKVKEIIQPILSDLDIESNAANSINFVNSDRDFKPLFVYRFFHL